MYNTKIVCTYHTEEVFLETDQITDKEKEFVRDAIYRQEMLNILDMNEYSELEMDIKIKELYERIKDCEFFKNLMTKQFMTDDLIVGLMVLFSYEHLYLTHACISEFLETGTISDENMSNLHKNVFL